MQFDDVPCATKALNELYGHTLNGLVKGGIRLSYSKNPLGVRTPSVSGASGTTFNSGTNLFSAALAGIQETSRMHHLMNSRNSLPTSSFMDTPIARSRQDSVDVMSPTAFGSFPSPFARSFSPPSSSTSFQVQQPPRSIQTSFLEARNSFQPFVEPGDSQHTVSMTPSPGPSVEA